MQFEQFIVARRDKRSDAAPRLHCSPFFLWLLTLNHPAVIRFGVGLLICERALIWRDTEIQIRSKSPEAKARQHERNNRPDVRAKRIAAHQLRYQDPEYRREHNRKGVENFKKNKEKVYAYRKTRPDIYKDGMRNYLRVWMRNKRRTDPNYNLGNRLRSRIWHALRDGYKKSASTESLTGCTMAELRAHLEKQFLPGMSWERSSDWHIDHITPCAAFDLSKPKEQRACFHYSNLQPLFSKANLSKGGKFLKQQSLTL